MKLNEATLKRIDELRAQRGWTYYELAKVSGVSKNTFYNYKREPDKYLTLHTCCKILGAFDMSFSQFFDSELFDNLEDGIRIKELCGEYHMNPSTLSQKACGNSTISSFMSKDQETLYMPTIYSICLALNLSLKEFFDSQCFDDIDEINEIRNQNQKPE